MTKINPYLRTIIDYIIGQNKKNPLIAFYDTCSTDPLEIIAVNSDKLPEPANHSKIDELQRYIASEIEASINKTLGILSDALNITVKTRSKDTNVCYILPSKWENTIILVIHSYLGKVVVAVAGTQPELAKITLELISSLSPSDQERVAIIVAQSKSGTINVFQEMATRTISNLELKLAGIATI